MYKRVFGVEAVVVTAIAARTVNPAPEQRCLLQAPAEAQPTNMVVNASDDVINQHGGECQLVDGTPTCLLKTCEVSAVSILYGTIAYTCIPRES